MMHEHEELSLSLLFAMCDESFFSLCERFLGIALLEDAHAASEQRTEVNANRMGLGSMTPWFGFW